MQSKMLSNKKILFLMLIFAIIIGACGGTAEEPQYRPVRDIMRDPGTRNTIYAIKYINEKSGGAEQQSLDFIGAGGSWQEAQITYGQEGDDSTEYLDIAGPRDLERYGFRKQLTQSEALLGVTESAFSWLRWTTKDLSVFLNSRNEVVYNFAGLGQRPVKVKSNYMVSTDANGYPDINNGTHWFDEISWENAILSDKWSPFYMILEDSKFAQLSPDWARTNREFDIAKMYADAILDSARDNDWRTIDPKLGTVKMVALNHNNAAEFFGFENEVNYYVNVNGETIHYRVVPKYVILDQNLYFGWGKQNSTQNSLQALVLEAQDGDSYYPVAGIYFLKGRFAPSSVYFMKIHDDESTPESIIKQMQIEMDGDIPQEFRNIKTVEIGSATERRLLDFVAQRDELPVAYATGFLG